LRDLRYGPHPCQTIDFYRASSDRPTPLVVFIHGGGFTGGDKSRVAPRLVNHCLKAGLSLASINYRLAPEVHLPTPMFDAARAVQFLRFKAADLNIDPDAVAACGGSAGAGISLWLAFHDDLAQPESDDPIRRQSTRLKCAGAINGQCSYDPRFMETFVGPRAWDYPTLPMVFGLSRDALKTPPAFERYERSSPIRFLTPDDPPVFLLYTTPAVPLGPDAPWGRIIHHPVFGQRLKARLDLLGIECVLRNTADYKVNKIAALDKAFAEMVAFFRRHLQPQADTRPAASGQPSPSPLR